MEMYSKTQIINMIEREVNKLQTNTFKNYEEHEFFDTCDIYKLFQRLKNPAKKKLAPSKQSKH